MKTNRQQGFTLIEVLIAIIILSILFAIVICLSMFYFFDVSVNFITISGLTICFGMLLDNSILVLDSVHRHLTERRNGDPKQALIRGTREVSFPIISTTLTTTGGFLPLILDGGGFDRAIEAVGARIPAIIHWYRNGHAGAHLLDRLDGAVLIALETADDELAAFR